MFELFKKIFSNVVILIIFVLLIAGVIFLRYRFKDFIQGVIFIIIGGVYVLALLAFLGKSKSWWMGGLLSGVVGGLLAAAVTFSWTKGFVWAMILSIPGFILDYFLSRNTKRWSMWWRSFSSKKGGRLSWVVGLFGRGRGGGSGGSSGFGGGSSGGGGASGGW